MALAVVLATDTGFTQRGALISTGSARAMGSVGVLAGGNRLYRALAAIILGESARGGIGQI